MDVDESSKSRMSLDALDDIYLGPDDELDSNSGSSGGSDALNVIPDPSYLALADGLALYDNPDLYLGPEDTLIESDDAPAVPDLPMTVNESTPEPHPASPASPAVPEAPIPSNSATPKCQLPEPALNNEELRAMVWEFMPIGSYDQTKNHLGDYQQRHGNLPDPTVAQLLEADRPFRMAWAETCDKLWKADADLRRMQRVRESTSEMLKVLDTLIDFFEDSILGAQCSVLGTQYSGFGTRALVLGIWDLGFGRWYFDIYTIAHMTVHMGAGRYITYYSDLSPYNTRERTCIISRMIRASGPWAHDNNILDYDGWAGREIIPDGGGWAHAGNI
ncbi:uncharacterized protein HD556DRAFT_1311767 [Suillus plorans]|uniref:Uncharacterized protein n=1 Tax=Suillus plorans TaxID=116603 RepID=A0A9P7AHY1_9AGAM|nr:uncharacterized protein HD556DRAFT_1311767 [Suillus plorans]KAG1788847.1 hypothetical protein HD556DRAFT_1311767 [Suillus plorans]